MIQVVQDARGVGLCSNQVVAKAEDEPPEALGPARVVQAGSRANGICFEKRERPRLSEVRMP